MNRFLILVQDIGTAYPIRYWVDAPSKELAELQWYKAHPGLHHMWVRVVECEAPKIV